MELLNHNAVISYQRTGSSYTCDPPVTDTDEDWVVLVKSEYESEFNKHIMEEFFPDLRDGKYANAPDYRTEFVSWRPHSRADDKRNLIVTYNPEWYQLFVEATEIAKEENLLKKEDRVALFEQIMRKYRSASSQKASYSTEIYLPWATISTGTTGLSTLSWGISNPFS